jgi:hypothetical protein
MSDLGRGARAPFDAGAWFVYTAPSFQRLVLGQCRLSSQSVLDALRFFTSSLLTAADA